MKLKLTKADSKAEAWAWQYSIIMCIQAYKINVLPKKQTSLNVVHIHCDICSHVRIQSTFLSIVSIFINCDKTEPTGPL